MKTQSQRRGLPNESIAIAPCSFDLIAIAPQSDGLYEIQITPAGRFKPSDGREMQVASWNIDAAIAQRVIAQFSAKKTPPVLDYEHQTLHAEKNGQPAPAAGWLRSLEWREGEGLFGLFELTDRAKAFVGTKEYRYFSPVFMYDIKTGDILNLMMGALTNNPAIDGMALVAERAAARFITPQEEHIVNKLLLAIATALVLSADATEDQALEALNAHFDGVAKLRKDIGVAEDADVPAMLAACSALKSNAKPDPAKFVPVGVVADLQAQVAALTSNQLSRDVGELVSVALNDGKLLPSQEAWATELGKSDIAALKSYLSTAPAIAALTRTQTGGKMPDAKNEDGLTESELAICTATGLDPKDFAKNKV